MMISQNAQRWFRFIAGGLVNTGFTYILYIGINAFLIYQIAYLIAYIVGIVFAYLFNATIVFRVALSWRGFFSYPIVYVVQYVVSAFLLGGLVELLQIKESIAPLFVAVALIPISYVMSKSVLGNKASEQSSSQGDILP